MHVMALCPMITPLPPSLALCRLWPCALWLHPPSFFLSPSDYSPRGDQHLWGVPGCAEFLGSLDDAGKGFFMLWGPANGRTPANDIDACAREFVRVAWSIRSTTVNSQADDPLVIGDKITSKRKYGGGLVITDFFKTVTAAPQPKHTRTHARAHASPNLQLGPLEVVSRGVDSVTRQSL